MAALFLFPSTASSTNWTPVSYGSSTATNWNVPELAAVAREVLTLSPVFSRRGLDRLALARVAVSTPASSPGTSPLPGSSSIPVAILPARATVRPHRLRPGTRRRARR